MSTDEEIFAEVEAWVRRNGKQLRSRGALLAMTGPTETAGTGTTVTEADGTEAVYVLRCGSSAYDGEVQVSRGGGVTVTYVPTDGGEPLRRLAEVSGPRELRAALDAFGSLF
jgi:hypothetical protein